MAGWSSGWVEIPHNVFAFGFAHNLGTTDLVFSVYWSAVLPGQGTVSVEDIDANFGSKVEVLNENEINLILMPDGFSGGLFRPSIGVPGYIKVAAISTVSDPVPGTGDLCKILSEDSGYQMFRNGLTIQWMSSPAFTTESSQVVNFPIPFASKPFKVVASTRYPNGDAVSQTFFQVVSWAKDGATIFAQSGFAAFNPVYADIIAIGIAEVTDCPGSTDPNDPSDPEGTKISQLTSAAELKDDDLFVISKENTGDGIYDISQKITLSQLATYIAGAEPPAPTPPAEGIVHFSSKIISNASSSTESKAFEDDAFSDITAAGVYEIQSTYAFEYYKLATPQGPYPYTRLDPNRAGDGWNSSSGLGKAAPTVAKQDLKSMAIPAGTTVKFSLDWTHLGATYTHHNYTREDLIFFEITGPALIVDLSPGEQLPDASSGTHLASMGITQGKVYNWYNILPYPDTDGSPNRSYATIFDKGTFSEQRTDTGWATGAPSINSLYWNDGVQWSQTVSQELFFRDSTRATIDSLFKLPATTANGVAIDQRTLRNMPYTSTLIIE